MKDEKIICTCTCGKDFTSPQGLGLHFMHMRKKGELCGIITEESKHGTKTIKTYAEVIPITKSSDQAYTCGCGSVTWILRRDNKIECSECGDIINKKWI